jgi:hypothetical protein
MLFFVAIFAIFLLSASRAYARTKETGRVSVLSTNAALTTNHLPRKANPWLPTSLNQTSAFSGSPRQRERSLPKWNYPSRPITTLSKLSLPTKLRSTFKLNPASKLSLKLSVGNLANTNPSSAGEQFTASNNFSNIKPEPAERRVLPSDVRGLSCFVVSGRAVWPKSGFLFWSLGDKVAIAKFSFVFFCPPHTSVVDDPINPQYGSASHDGLYLGTSRLGAFKRYRDEPVLMRGNKRFACSAINAIFRNMGQWVVGIGCMEPLSRGNYYPWSSPVIFDNASSVNLLPISEMMHRYFFDNEPRPFSSSQGIRAFCSGPRCVLGGLGLTLQRHESENSEETSEASNENFSPIWPKRFPPWWPPMRLLTGIVFLFIGARMGNLWINKDGYGLRWVLWGCFFFEFGWCLLLLPVGWK